MKEVRKTQEFKEWCKAHNFESNRDSEKLFLIYTENKARLSGDDMVVCRVCGKYFTRLKRHLQVQHDMSLGTYKKLFPNAKTVAPAFSKTMRKVNEEHGGVANLTPAKKGERRAAKDENVESE